MIRHLLLSFVLSISSAAAALPKIHVERINGFEVHFVDVGAGNSFGLSFQVPYGTLHDFGRFLGRAHLLEHLLHVGSLRYPGYHAFDELLQPAGVESNASTSWNRTFYYAAGRDDQAELMIRVFLAMLGGLEWNGPTVEKERKVVINEIVEEGLPQESDAFVQMPFTQILPAGHPWSHPLLGDLPSLTGLTLEDLKALYDQVYRPGIVKVALHGNFSDPEFLRQVREWTLQNLKASPAQNGRPLEERRKDEAPKPDEWRTDNRIEPREPAAPPRPEDRLATRPIPSMFSDDHSAAESEKSLYLHSENSRTGGIFLELDARLLPANSQAMDFLVDYLSTEIPGGFIQQLKTEKGWISEGSFFGAKVRERQILVFNYTLTEEGRERGSDVNEFFFRALKDAQNRDIDGELLERLKKRKLHDLEVASRSVGSFLKTYASVLNSEKSLAQQVEDIKNISARDLHSAALLLRPDQALYVEAGPELEEMDFDGTYNRKFILKDNRAKLDRYLEVMRAPAQGRHSPVLKKVDLGNLDSVAFVPFFLQSRPDAAADHRYALDLRAGLPDAALSLEFKLDIQSADDLVALDLIADAFEERYASEITYLNYNYFVSLGSSRTTRHFSLTASGDNAYAARALEWKLRMLADFEPTAEEVRRARERLADDRLSKYVHDFSAILGFAEAKSLVDPFDVGVMKTREIALSLTHGHVNAIWRRLRRHANRNLAAAGQIPVAELGSVNEAAAELFPQPLSAAAQIAEQDRVLWNGQTVEIEKPFALPKGGDAYSLTRFYRGPRVRDFEESAAFVALNSLLSARIYGYNRGEQQLGYIHRSTVKILDEEHRFLALYGATDGGENAAKTVAGWDHIFAQLESGAIADEEITAAISSLINELSQANTTARDWVSTYSGGLSLYGDPRSAVRMLAAAKALTPEDVRASARKYLFANGTPYTQLTLHGCEDVLTP